MPRNLKKNRFIYMHPVEINFSTASGDLATSIFSVAPPSMSEGCQVIDWGVVLGTAQLGGTTQNIVLQKAGTSTNVSNALTLTSLATNTELTGSGNGVTIAAGERLELSVSVTGTVTTTAKGTLYIGFAL